MHRPSSAPKPDRSSTPIAVAGGPGSFKADKVDRRARVGQTVSSGSLQRSVSLGRWAESVSEGLDKRSFNQTSKTEKETDYAAISLNCRITALRVFKRKDKTA